MMKLEPNLGQAYTISAMSYQCYKIWLVVDECDKMRLASAVVDPRDALGVIASPFEVRFHSCSHQLLSKILHCCITSIVPSSLESILDFRSESFPKKHIFFSDLS